VGPDPEPESDPELAAAIARGAASFDFWIRARSSTEERLAPNEIRSAFKKYRDPVFKAFEKSEGRVYASFYCNTVVGAAVLTIKKRRRLILRNSWLEVPVLHLVYNVADSEGDPQVLKELQGVLYDAWALSAQANDLLRGKQRQLLLDEMYGLLTDLLALLDAVNENEVDLASEIGSQAENGIENSSDTTLVSEGEVDERIRDSMRSLELQRAQLDRLRTQLRRSGTVQGQVDYLVGMLGGIGLLGGLAALGGWLLHLAGVSATTRSELTVALVSGGIGATISVLSRMTGGKLVINFEMGRVWLTVVGAVRPFVGAVFGLVLLALLEASFLPIDLSGDEQARFFIVALLSFAAGFNERWAQDVLLQTTGRTIDAISE
jgi:hypothetical protein